MSHVASPTRAAGTQAGSPERGRALVVANPIAGRGRARAAAERLVAGLARAGYAAELCLTAARGDGARRVARRAGDTRLVVAVGGDGTLGEVVSGLAGARVPIGALPMGTANVLARDLGLPRTVEGLLGAIAGGRTRAVDVASVEGRDSFLVTGVGFDGRLVQALERRRTGPITRWSYVQNGLRALAGYREPRLSVTLDGERLHGAFGLVLVANIVHYAGFRCLAPDRELDDGLFEAYLFRGAGRLELLAHALRGLTAGLPGGSCERLRGRRFRVESEEPVPYQVDGDYGGTTPVAIEVTSRPIQLLVP